eukprot:m.58846 g.58846  ORF g.58846 m.58846 type:complete len:319 (+) comp13536_c0_seq1:67-1023(+)
MAGLFTGPIRGGNRGGQGNFKWDDVKTDQKHRENYLAHSVMAPVGRWQKGRDLQWFAREKTKDGKSVVPAQIQSELDQIRMAEQDALAEALGLGKAERRVMGGPLTNEDVKAVFGKGEGEQEEAPDRVQGLGFSHAEGMAKPTLKLAADFEGIAMAPVGAQPLAAPRIVSAETQEALQIQERLQKAMEEVRRAKEKKEKKHKHKDHKEHKHKEHKEHKEHKHKDRKEEDRRHTSSSHHHEHSQSKRDVERDDRDRREPRESRDGDRDRERHSGPSHRARSRSRSRSRSPARRQSHRSPSPSRSRSRTPPRRRQRHDSE